MTTDPDQSQQLPASDIGDPARSDRHAETAVATEDAGWLRSTSLRVAGHQAANVERIRARPTA